MISCVSQKDREEEGEKRHWKQNSQQFAVNYAVQRKLITLTLVVRRCVS
jgi:hypothetical protein